MKHPAPDMDELLSHAQFIRGLARSLVLDEHRADDAVQQTWLAALRYRPDSRRPLRPWLATVLRNSVRRGQRSDRRRARRELATARPEAAPAIPDTLAREEMLQRVVEAVLDLEERYRLAVLLHYYEGLSYAEVAQKLGVSVETVRSRLKRARLQLRAQLDRSHPGGRRAWMPALAALAGIDRGALAGLATTGGVVMGIKTKLAVASLIAVAVAVVFWQASSGSGEAAVSRVDRGISDVPAEPAPSEIAATSPAESATTVKVEHFVRGHVRDESGNPVEGAPVFVGAKKDPFGDENPFHVQPGDYYGRALHTDGNGAFEVRFDEPRRVYVWHYSSGHIRPEWMPGRWVETPAEGVDFTTRLLPTATLVVRVNDLSEGRPVKRFECYAAVPGRGSQRIRTEEFVAEHRLVLPETASDHPVQVRLYLGKSLTDTPVNKSLQIAAGDRREVTLAIRGKGRVRGQVVDSGGRSLGGALVYLGGQMKARGDEPFRAFRESRIGNGARSDADGGFELIGEGLKITAWHPDYTSVTVPIEESMRIVLPDRGAIRGRVVDREGNPVAGLRITLDQSESRETDEDGSFAFEKVEAGVRGLLFKDRSRMVGVCVEPGETKEITLNPGIESVRIDVPIDEPVSGGLVGEGDIYLIRLAKGSQRSITVTDIWPGRYRFLGEEGRLGWVEIDGPEARLEFGRGTLTIRAEPGTRVSVIPAGLDRQMRKVHAKLTNRRVGQDGEVTLASLPTGRYDVCVGRREIEVVASVEVNTEGSAIDLP